MLRQLFDDDTDTRKVDVLALLARVPTQLQSIEDAVSFARTVRAEAGSAEPLPQAVEPEDPSPR